MPKNFPRLKMLTFTASIIVLCFGPQLVAGDFDGDRFMDLAVGVPGETTNGEGASGAINAIFGSSSGLLNTGELYLNQNSPNIAGECEATDLFGYAVATGDFDGDGYYDLAVGAPSEDIGTVTNAGAINVIYGYPGGLTSTGDQMFYQDNCVVNSDSEASDYFGAALAAGDFDGDGYDDLAVGSPYEDIGSSPALNAAGAVVVLWGSASGLTSNGRWLYAGNCSGSEDPEDHFGWALATGDFDNDGFEDLAIGAPGDEIGGDSEAGSISILYGHSGGLSSPASGGFFSQDSPGVEGGSEAEDEFGDALTSGDFNGDGYMDLAIGVHNEMVDSVDDAGIVNILYGSSNGITSAGDLYVHQGMTTPAASANEENDFFGEALSSGDYNGDGFMDLAVGVPQEDWTGVANTGMTYIFWGSSSGITNSVQYFVEGDMYGGNTAFTNHFGYALASGDFNRDGRVDLAISSPFYDDPSYDNTGTVYVALGTAGDMDPNGGYFDHCSDIAGGCEEGDEFGKALASIPRPDHIFIDGFEDHTTDNWN